jgi:transposase
MAKLYSTKEMAKELGLAEESMRKIAQRLKIGQKVGQTWVFTESDKRRFEKRNRKPGRPAA